MTGTDIIINAHDGGRFSAYLASPASGKGPGIVVSQEIFGVNAAMRQICDHYASLGYFAICPDIFWRQEPGVQITDKTEAEWDKAFKLFGGFDLEAGMADLSTTLAHLRKIPGFSGKAGATGYCLGGKLTYLMACRTDVDASAGYYGVGIADLLDDAKNIKKPLILHIPEQDKYVDPAAQKKMHEGLDPHPLVTLYDYPGADHAFARPNGQNYHKESAVLANRRTEEFFSKYLW